MANPDYTAQDVPTWAANLDSMVSLKAVGEIENPLLELPLLNSLAFSKGLGSMSFSRSSLATYIDRYGVVQDVGVDVPRFEKNGFLSESSRTNELEHNNDFSQGVWTKTQSSLGTAVTGPDGVGSSADKLQENTTGNIHFLRQTVLTLSPSDVVSGSAYVKQDEKTWAWMRVQSRDNVQHSVYLNLATGAIGTLLGLTASQVRVRTLADGWYWLAIDGVDIVTGGTDPFMDIAIADGDGLASYTGAGTTNGIQVSRAQFEVGAFASSEISTAGAPVTRNGEVSTDITIVGNIGLQINPGTILIDADINGLVPTPGQQIAMSISGEAKRTINASTFGGAARVSWADVNIQGGGAPPIETTRRYGITFDGTTVKFFIDGLLIGSDIPSSFAVLGTDINIGAIHGHVTNLRIYEGALSDRQMAVA